MSKEKKPQPTLGDGLITLNSEAVLIPSRPNRLVVESIPSNVSYSDLHSVSLGDAQLEIEPDEETDQRSRNSHQLALRSFGRFRQIVNK